MITKLMMCLLGMMFISAVTYAQEIRNPTAIGPHVGWYKAKDADDGKPMFGGALRLKLTNAIGFEGTIDYRQEEYRNGSILAKTWPVMLTGLFYATPNIYGAAGIGWYNSQIEFRNDLSQVSDRSSQKFGWHFGAGLEIPLTERVMINTDFRYTFLNYDFGEVPGAGEIRSDFFAVTAGMLFVIN